MEGFESNNKLLLVIGIVILLISGALVFYFTSGSKISIFNGNQTSQAKRTSLINNISGTNTPKLKENKNSDDFNFTAQERPAFQFPSVAYASDLKNKTSIYNANGLEVAAKLNISQSGTGSEVALNISKEFTPGKYTLVINRDGKKISQDFTWGVLAINPNKSIYTPGQTALLALAVLDEKGKMVCDAKVTLKITDPSGNTSISSTDNKIIKVNKECFIKDMTTKPDYETAYKVQEPGIYQMELSAVTKNGTYQIEDSFLVEKNVDFDVERVTATRIFPFSTYPVVLKITANKDFEGQITDVIPNSFTVTKSENISTYDNLENKNGNFYVTWNVSIKKGEKINLGYNFKSPLISPQFYLLGPLSFLSGGTTVFEENRTWQLAIDDVNYSSAILATQGLIHYYRLGEPSGTTVTDSIGTSSGTFFNSPNLAQTGAIVGDSNTAVQFNSASTQYADVNNVSNWGAGPVSFEVWFKKNVAGAADKGFLQRTDGVTADRWFFFQCGASCTPSGAIKIGANGSSLQSTTAITDNTTWHHVVATKGTTATDWKLYIDGVDVSGTPPSVTPGNDYGIMKIGIDVANDFQNGYLDEIAIYNVVLTPAQVLAHYNLGSGTASTCEEKILSNPGLSAFWRMGDASSHLTDIIGGADSTVETGLTYGVTGAVTADPDTAITFDGSTSFATVPSNTAMDLGDGPFSIGFWFKRNASGLLQYVLNRGHTTGSAWAVGFLNGAGSTLQLWEEATAPTPIVSTGNAQTDTSSWHYAVITKNGSARHIYIDGTEDTVLGTNVTLTNSTSVLNIGRETSSNFLNGSLDEVALYKSELSSTQVADNFTSCGGTLAAAIGNFRFEGVRMEGLRIN